MGCGVALLYVISVVMLTAAYAVNIESDPWSYHEAFPGVRDNVGALVALVIAVVALLCAPIGFALRRKSPLGATAGQSRAILHPRLDAVAADPLSTLRAGSPSRSPHAVPDRLIEQLLPTGLRPTAAPTVLRAKITVAAAPPLQPCHEFSRSSTSLVSARKTSEGWSEW